MARLLLHCRRYRPCSFFVARPGSWNGLVTGVGAPGAQHGQARSSRGCGCWKRLVLGFLESFGFERVARLREAGYKFDRFPDLVFLLFWLTPPTRP